MKEQDAYVVLIQQHLDNVVFAVVFCELSLHMAAHRSQLADLEITFP